MREHLMLDFETLGTKPNTAVLSLGAVIFTSTQIIDKRYWVFDVNYQLKNHRTVDISTIAWWMNQGEKAKAVFGEAQTRGVKLPKFVEDFHLWLKGRDVIVWGNGATFDVSIIESILTQASIPFPWKYPSVRCYRTLKQTNEKFKEVERKGVHHNALDDALFQAENIQNYLKVSGNRA